MPSVFFTDRYCLAMAQVIWRSRGRIEPHSDNDLVSFEMFVRRIPNDRGYMVTAGLGTALWWLEHLEVTRKDWEWLIDNGFEKGFADFLYEKGSSHARFFTGRVDAIPEGIPIGAETPILRVTASRIEATLVESLVLSAVNHQIMVASKAARIVEAAHGRPVWDFSLRRLHGPEAGIGVARAAYIAVCAGTATVEAGRLLGIPTTGTMAHHLAMMHGREGERLCFENFLREYPDSHALLVDTYDTLEGVRNACRASLATHIPLKAIRLDSGDLKVLSNQAAEILHDFGFDRTKILASNDLDEYSIAELSYVEAPIDVFGVGTMLGTVPDAPNVGGVYKLVEQHARTPRYVMKLAESKANDPGSHQVWRDRHWDRPDVISLATEETPDEDYDPLMIPAMIHGRRLFEDDLDEIRSEAIRRRLFLPDEVRRIQDPVPMRVTRSQALWELRRSLGDRSPAASPVKPQEVS